MRSARGRGLQPAPIDAARPLVPARRRRAEAPHERSVRQRGEFAERARPRASAAGRRRRRRTRAVRAETARETPPDRRRRSCRRRARPPRSATNGFGPSPTRSGRSKPASALRTAPIQPSALPSMPCISRKARPQPASSTSGEAASSASSTSCPDRRVALAIVDHRAGLVGHGLRLDERHPRPHPERRRRQRAIDDPAALELVGHDHGGVEVDGLGQPGDGQPERRDPDADDRHGAPIVSNIRSICKSRALPSPCIVCKDYTALVSANL